jgi:hypothetical protein
MSETKISRRTAVKALAAVGVGGMFDVSSAAAAPSGYSRWHRADDLIMIIRHGEKPTGTGAPYGVTAEGVQDSESLTTTGWARAGALVELFAPAVGPVRRGLVRPAAVFASNLTGPAGGSAREQETVSLVVTQLGVQLNTDYGVGDEQQLVAGLAGATSRPALICWEHDHIATIANDLGNVSPAVPQTWPDDRFDVVWVFVKIGAQGGTPSYRFYQVPELLLPGDSDTPIS